MAPATMWRHLAVLVDGGLIVRRDSPNGKRYTRKGSAGELELALGFDLSPLFVRAEEFEALAEDVRVEERALKLVKERITLSAGMISKSLDVSLRAAQDLVAELGWREMTGRGRYRAWSRI